MGQEMMVDGLAQGKVTLKSEIEEINRLHSEATKLAKTSLIKAKEAGEKLVAVKAAVKHGAFEALVNETCDFSVRTARTYMKIFREWDRLIEDMGPGQMSIITLEDGIAKLTQAKKAQKPEPVSVPVPAAGPCFKGGAHQWEADHELPGEYCAKCHEQRPSRGQAADEDDPGDFEAPQPDAEEEADDRVAARRVGDDCLTRLVKLLKEAVDLADQAYQEHPSALRDSILESLNVAYEDCLKWRKQ